MKLPHHHDPVTIDLMTHIPGDKEIENVSEAMKQLGDKSRLKIFWLLCHTEECVIDIAEAVGMSSPAVSHHLRLLKSAGLITSHREGKDMLYKASNSCLAEELHHMIEKVALIACPK